MLNQEKLLLHMAWANQFVLGKLGELTEQDWKLQLTKDDWSIQELTNHIVLAADRYATGVSGESVTSNLDQGMVIPLATLKALCAGADGILLMQSHMPDEIDLWAFSDIAGEINLVEGLDN